MFRFKEEEKKVGTKSNLEKLAGEIADMNYTDFTKGEDFASLTKRYSQQGQKAMDDTIGKVAARTGGLASSYATAAGNQAYNDWMGNLEDAARALYDSQRQEKIDNFGISKSLYDQAYQESRDRESDTRYLEDRTSTMTADEKASLANELYYNANAYPTYADYKTAFPGTLLTEADFNQVKGTATGSYREENKGQIAADEKAKLDRLWQDAEVLWSTGKTLTDDMREALGLTPEMEAAYAMYYTPQVATPTLDIGGEDLLTQLESGNYSPAVLNTYEQTYGESYFNKVVRDKSYAEWSENDLESVVNYLASIGREAEADALATAWNNNNYNETIGMLKDRTWTLVDDGGKNYGGGINRNAKIRDKEGHTYTLGEFIGVLANNSFDGDRDKAKKWILAHQSEWGVTE